MITLLLVVILFLAVVGWLILRDRIQTIEARLHSENRKHRAILERQIAELTARVASLERKPDSVQTRQSTVPAPPQATVPEVPRTFVQAPASGPESAPRPPRVETVSEAISSPAPALAPASSKPAWSDRLHQLLSDSEWETLLAGSVMNKIGALVLVIGIALFLGYSFQRVNPAGRAAAAAVVSAGILAGGIILERRQRYRVFSRGLIGAGWAALYTTAYAMYALPAAQIISSPLVGSILLLAVSVGMVAHSLRYRAQAVTGIAYFTAFAALAVTPSTGFAVESLIPLAASLLYFAWRFEWHAMAMFGILATYATCISKGSSDAPLYETTSLFIVYWLLFESFDVLRSRRGSRAFGLTWLFPLNTIAFLGLTYQTWSAHAPLLLWRIAALSAFLFFCSAMFRLPIRTPALPTGAANPFECIRNGTYQAPLAVAAVLAALSILGRVTGFWSTIALASEAEILYLAGVRFHSRFLRGLARIGFAASLSDVLETASRESGVVSVFGVSLQRWTPSVIVHIGLFYANRALAAGAFSFSFAATGLAALVITSELTPHAASVTLFVFALGLLEFALRKGLIDFRIQSYLVASAAAVLTVWAGGFAPHASASVWIASAIAAVACWLLGLRMLSANLNAGLRDVFASCGSGFALLTGWMLLPGAPTAVAWTALALVFLLIGLRLNIATLRWQSYGIAAVAALRCIFITLAESGATDMLPRILDASLAIALLFTCEFLLPRSVIALSSRERHARSYFSVLAVLLLTALLYHEVSGGLLTVAWGLEALGLPRQRISRSGTNSPPAGTRRFRALHPETVHL